MKDADAVVVKEFGGTMGAAALMLWSHGLPVYFWMALEYCKGGVFWPLDGNLLGRMRVDLVPDWTSVYMYFGFVALEVLFAYTLPGPTVKGLPVPSEGNKQYEYHCNALSSWYCSLLILFSLHYTGLAPLTLIADHFGHMMVLAMLFSDIVAVLVYIAGVKMHKTTRMSGSLIYDFFMGAWLNPRIGSLDLKLFAEIRVSWMTLFFLTLSAAAKQYFSLGYVSSSMGVVLLAHFLYSNACMKGEECVPTTWDIFYEKWGWMLVYWNLAGVPFVYCFPAYYILRNNPQLPLGFAVSLAVVLLTAYYFWDTSQSQKNRFRMQLRGTYIPRNSFPQLPYGTLTDPQYITAECGDKLLVSGWWKYARKVHYTADITMAWVWGLSCGFEGLLPYFYPVFFMGMIYHRYTRDIQRCKRKYGKDWDRYTRVVPYAFIPGIF